MGKYTDEEIRKMPKVTINDNWKPISLRYIGLYTSISIPTKDKSEILCASLSINLPNKTKRSKIVALIIDAPNPVISE